MRSLFQRASLGLLLALVVATTASADVNVYLGYLNTGNRDPVTGQFPVNPANVPFPFDNSATNTMMSLWGSNFPHDTGVMMFQNTGANPVTLDPGLNVQVQNMNFQVWDSPLPPEYNAYLASINFPPEPSLPFVLDAGKTLVVAETWNFNFESAFHGLGINPVINGSINGVPFSIEDTQRVLLGHEAANGLKDHTMTTPFQFAGTIPVGSPPQNSCVPEPSSLLLGTIMALTGLAGLRLKRRANAEVPAEDAPVAPSAS